MKVIVVRHCEVEHNKKGIYSNVDEDLNSNGIAQAEELKNKIKTIDYDVCYCSPLLRARHTANIINTADRLIVPISKLAERDPKDLNGKPLEFTNREEYWNYYSSIKYGNSESMRELFNRVFSFLDELKERPYNTVLIVTHSGVSKAFYAYFNGIPKDGKFLHLGLENCEIKEYQLNGSRPVLRPGQREL